MSIKGRTKQIYIVCENFGGGMVVTSDDDAAPLIRSTACESTGGNKLFSEFLVN